MYHGYKMDCQIQADGGALPVMLARGTSLTHEILSCLPLQGDSNRKKMLELFGSGARINGLGVTPRSDQFPLTNEFV